MYTLRLARRGQIVSEKCSTLEQLRLVSRTRQVTTLPSFQPKTRQRDRRYAREVVTQSVFEWLYGPSKSSKQKRRSRVQSVSPTNKRYSSQSYSHASSSSPKSYTRRSVTSSRTTRTKTDNQSESQLPLFPRRLKTDHITLQRDHHSMVNIPQTVLATSTLENQQYSSQITMTYQSGAVVPDELSYVKRDEITIFQETHTGGTFVVFKAFLKPGDTFSFKSQRTNNDRFQLIICINDLVNNYLSSCCEFPYQDGCQIGEDNSLFRILSIEGVQPCRKCLEEMNLSARSTSLYNRRSVSATISPLKLPIINTNQLTPEMKSKSKSTSISKVTNEDITNRSKPQIARDDDTDINDFHTIASTTTSSVTLPIIHRSSSSSSIATLKWSPRESEKQSTVQDATSKPIEIIAISKAVSLPASPKSETKFEKNNELIVSSNPIISSSNETPYSQSLMALLQSSATPFELPKPILPRKTGDVENFSIVSFDQHEQTQLNVLRSIVNFIRTFNDIDALNTFLNESIHTKIILLIPFNQTQSLIKQFHELTCIYSIYLLSTTPSEPANWMKDYSKIVGVYSTIESLRDHLLLTLPQSSIRMIPVVSVTENCCYDMQFTYTHLLKETLLLNDEDSDLKRDLIEFARFHYADNLEEMKNIIEFERDFTSQKVFSWYTRNSFISKILYRAFRTQEVDLLYKMRYIIQCLYKEFKTMTMNETTTVYTVLDIPIENALKFEEHINGLVIFAGYLPTVLNKPQSVNVNEQISVMFSIKLGTGYGVRIKDLCSSDSNIDVLININTVFRLISIEKITTTQWIINLESISSIHNQVSQLVNFLRYEIEAPVVLLQLSKLLLATQHYVECDYLAELLYQDQSLRNDSALLASLAAVHHLLGNADDERGDVKAACKQFFKSLRAFQSFLPADHPLMSASYNNIGSMYFKDNDYDEAINYHRKALECQLKCSSPDTDAIATYSNNIGAVYFEQGKYSEALTYLQRAATVLETLSSAARMPNLCVIYQKIAACYWRMDKAKEALDYYQKTLDIQLVYLPPTAHQISVTYFNLSTAYARVGQIDEAVSSAERSVEQLLKIYPPDHQEVKENQAQLEIVRQKQWLQQVLSE